MRVDGLAAIAGAAGLAYYAFYEIKYNNGLNRLKCIFRGHDLPKIKSMQGEEMKYYGKEIVITDVCARCERRVRIVYKLETFMREKFLIGRMSEDQDDR